MHFSFIHHYDYSIISYMTPDCEHCKNMKNWYQKIALYFKTHRPKLPVAQMNCNKYSEFCQMIEIPSYPDIKFYIKGHSVRYSGKRNMRTFKKWIKNVLNKHPTELKSYTELQALRTLKKTKKSKPTRGIFIFLGDKKTKGYHTFDLVAKSEKDFGFGWTTSQELEHYLSEGSRGAFRSINKKKKLVWFT